MADDTNVTQFPGAGELPENPLQIKHRQGFCDHPAIRLDDHSRTLECTACGATLDPFNFLRNNAATLQRAWQSHAAVSGDLSRLIERVTQLKKEETRLKGRVATLKKKLDGAGEVVVVKRSPK